jgi:hypothetical protein
LTNVYPNNNKNNNNNNNNKKNNNKVKSKPLELFELAGKNLVPPQVIAILFYYWCKKNYWKKTVFFKNYLFDRRIRFYGPKISLKIVFSGSLVHSGPCS